MVVLLMLVVLLIVPNKPQAHFPKVQQISLFSTQKEKSLTALKVNVLYIGDHTHVSGR